MYRTLHCTAATLAVATAFSNTDAQTTLAPVVVTASRFDESATRHPPGVTVITARDIERSTAATVPQLLQSLAGIRTRDLSGTPNVQVDMRGFGIFGDQNTLVLLDGVRISEYEQLTVNWAGIPLQSIERIEIIRGGGAVLYGTGATGGTINIITKAPEKNKRNAYFGAGAAGHDTREYRAGGNLAGENAGLRLHLGHFESDNYRQNNQQRIDNAQAEMRWQGAAGLLALKLSAEDQRTGLPGSISEAQINANRRQAATPFDFAKSAGGTLNIEGKTNLGSAELAANLGYRTRDTQSSFFVGTPFRNNVDTQVRAWSFAPRLRLRPTWGGFDHQTIIGGELEDWRYDANAQPSVVGRPHATQKSEALYAQHSVTLPTQTTVSAGVRGQRARYGVNDNAAPAANGERSRNLTAWDVSARHTFTQGVAAYAKLGRSFRLPNVNDNYSLFTATVTMLEPQTAKDGEVGMELSRGNAKLRAAAYRIDLKNELFFDPITFTNRNLQPTRREGAEIEARWQVTPTLTLNANYTHVNAKFREGRFGGMNIAGNAVPLVPRHAVNVGVGWEFLPRARVDVEARHVGSSAFDADETNTFGRKMPAYTVADLKLSYRSGGWLINGGVRNLLNEKYFSYGVFTGFPTYAALPAPERTGFVSAQYEFR
jgi:iron complex outermembrane receptor protein